MRTLPERSAHPAAFRRSAGPGWGPKLNQMTKKRTAWVLDTETKGTGAEMVPLERLEKRKRLQGERGANPCGRPEARPSRRALHRT